MTYFTSVPKTRFEDRTNDVLVRLGDPPTKLIGARFPQDSQSVECVIPRTLKSLDSVPFDTSQPLLTYNEARTMVITRAIEVVQINSPQWVSVLINGLFCEPAELSRRKIVRAPPKLSITFMHCRVFSVRHSISQLE
jgi:hypothetical protein